MAHFSKNLAEWRSVGSGPVRPDAPAGDSIRYDPDYERIQAEIDKLENLSGQPVDWKEVVRLSRGILQGKSKDLLVSAYLCRGLFEERGYEGLSCGLSCMQAMSTDFWEMLYPETKRMRARVNAVTWFSEKVGTAVSRKKPSAADREAVSLCVQQIDELEKWFDEKMGGESPGLRIIRQPMREYLQELESPTGYSGEFTAGGVSAAAVAEGPVIREITSVDEAGKAVEAAAEQIRRAAFFVQNHDPSIPWPYRVTRHLAWRELDSAPPHAEGETRIPPPSQHLPGHFQSLIEQGSWPVLLNQAEFQVTENPFWLDLHRLSVQALSRLGPSHEAAKQAVSGELLTLLRRIPELPELKFSDGMPFADEKTRRWVETDVVLPAGKETHRQPVPAGEGGKADTLTAVRDQAGRLMADGQFKEAMSLFQQEMAQAAHSRARFFLRLELARLCLVEGHVKAAISHLDLLDRQLESVSLEEWEPDLSLEVLQTLWAALNRLAEEAEPSPELVRRADLVYNRLCRIDVLGALEMEGKKKGGWSFFKK